MPSPLSYPGVYIEEIASGVHTITGVATSITAFIGRAKRGPVNEPVTINSFADYERLFGGLWLPGAMSYAVRDFYLNGGSQAIIVRLFHPFFSTDADLDEAHDAAQDAADAANASADPSPVNVAAAARGVANNPSNAAEPRKSASDAVADAAEAAAAAAAATVGSVKAAATAAVAVAAPVNRARLSIDTLKLEAANPGTWGNKLRVRVDHDTRPLEPGEAPNSLFNLVVRDGNSGAIEVFRNLSITSGHRRQVDKVLKNEAKLVRMTGGLPAARPAKSDNPAAGKDPWGDNTPATNAKVESAGEASDGVVLVMDDFTGPGKESNKQGLYALQKADLFNLLCIPPHTLGGDIETDLAGLAAKYCEDRRAMLLVDPRSTWPDKDAAKTAAGNLSANVGTSSKNAALFFPRLLQRNPLRDNQIEDFAPCGAVAGIFARTDSQRGVWKAPAGLEAAIIGAPSLSAPLSDPENGELNPLAVNCLRTMPAIGNVVWGSRTLQGADRLASEWKYIPVRRTALFLEESLYRGTQWIVFEPNDEPLWAQIRLNLGAFMQGLFRQGAFQGKTPRDAYFVKCDGETTTQADINLGIVNILAGFAPLKPAEFVVIKIQQMAGQIAT